MASMEGKIQENKCTSLLQRANINKLGNCRKLLGIASMRHNFTLPWTDEHEAAVSQHSDSYLKFLDI